MNWMNELSKEENNERFSLLVHRYFKLAVMKIMQDVREDYNVPEKDIASLVCAIMARLLNESCYAVGSQITPDYTLNDILSEKQISNLLKVLSGEGLKQLDRKEINLSREIDEFRKFVMKKSGDFKLI